MYPIGLVQKTNQTNNRNFVFFIVCLLTILILTMVKNVNGKNRIPKSRIRSVGSESQQ